MRRGHARTVQRGLRDFEPADHAARVGLHEPVRGILEPHERERAADALGPLRARNVVELGEHEQVLVAGEVAVRRERLRERDESLSAMELGRKSVQEALAQAQSLRDWRNDYQTRWGARFQQGGRVEIIRCYQDFMSRLDKALEDQEAAVAQHAMNCLTIYARTRQRETFFAPNVLFNAAVAAGIWLAVPGYGEFGAAAVYAGLAVFVGLPVWVAVWRRDRAAW